MANDKASIISKAQKFAAKGQIDKAIQEWDRVLAMNPRDGNTHNIIGDLFLRKGERQRAIDSFFKASRYFRDQGFALKAMALYKKILNLDTKSVDALVALAELNAERGLTGNANENYLSAAEICVKLKKTDDAVKIYEKMMRLSPDSYMTHLRIADLYVKIGLPMEARKVYIRSAEGLLKKGDADRAEKLFQKLIDMDKSEPSGYLGLCRLSCERGDFKKAMSILDKAAKKIPDNPDIVVARGRIAFRMGNADEALKSVEGLTGSGPINLEASKLLSEIYLGSGRVDEAWKAAKMSVDAMISGENYREAAELLQSFEGYEDHRAEALRRQASLLKNLGDVDAAVEKLKALGEHLAGEGRTNDAVGAFQEILDISPGDEEAEARIRTLGGVQDTGDEAEETEDDGLPGLGRGEGSFDATSGDASFDVSGYQEIGLGAKEHVQTKDDEDDTGSGSLRGFDIPESEEDVSIVGDAGQDDTADIESAFPPQEDTAVGKPPFPTSEEAAGSESSFSSHDESTGAWKASVNDAVTDESPAAPGGQGVKAGGAEALKEELAEADFYLQQGLQDEAVEIYRRLAAQYPDMPELAEKLAELAPAERPREVILPGSGGRKMDADAFFDSLGDMSDETDDTETEAAEEVASIFEAFKKGVEDEVEEGDFETHYNLGIAYKEMGLLEDAIRELQIATRVDSKSFQAGSMLAICYLEKGAYEQAVFGFRRLLQIIPENDDRHLSVKYDLATALEHSGDKTSALAIYRDILNVDSSFSDVAEKVKNLG